MEHHQMQKTSEDVNVQNHNSTTYDREHNTAKAAKRVKACIPEEHNV